MIRQPIVVVAGHIDHGKTSLLDKIRMSAIAANEAGGITQCISCSAIPLKTINKISGELIENINVKIPGLLFIDTPGHAAFNNLRKRGGNLADIAIVVVDINEGFMPQTIETIEILKTYKTPFIIAANKIDLIHGWKSSTGNIKIIIESQAENVKQKLDKNIYEIVGKIFELGFNSERFDRVDDFTKQIAIVPISAKTGEGISSLLMMIIGLAQKFLEQGLLTDVDGPAKGTIMEVKEETGLGKTMDTLIYDGKLEVNDTIVIGSLNEPIVTKVRALFEPDQNKDSNDKKVHFKSVKIVHASTGVKISSPSVDDVISGMPIRGCTKENLERIKLEIQKEVEEVIIHTDTHGIVVKAESLGSLEALTNILKEKKILIKSASIGNITKKDIGEAHANIEKDPLYALILGFNVNIPSDINPGQVSIILNNVIYKLLEDLEKWQLDEKKRQEAKELDNLIRPCKIELLKGYLFRQCNPAVIGSEVLAGTLKSGMPIMKSDGQKITTIKSMQLEKETVSSAEKGKQIAIAMDDVTIGRNLNEEDILFSYIPEDHFRKLKTLKQYLTHDEKEILREIAQIMRVKNPVWGI